MEVGPDADAALVRIGKLNWMEPAVLDRRRVRAALAELYSHSSRVLPTIRYVGNIERGYVLATFRRGSRHPFDNPLAWPDHSPVNDHEVAPWGEANSRARALLRRRVEEAWSWMDRDFAGGATCRVSDMVTIATGYLGAASGARTLERYGILRSVGRRGLPFLDILEAGIWYLWVFERLIIAAPRPALFSDGDGELHRDGGPAVVWPDGRRWWYWHGRSVPHIVAESPEQLDPVNDILRCPNEADQELMIERYGLEHFVRSMAEKPIASDHFGSLWRVELNVIDANREPLCVVEVVNSTPEPDGTFTRHFLRVPPEARSPKAAVAWTFGMEEGAYSPARES